MILNEIFKNPVISFGLGMTMLSCEVGDEVTVWQNEVYNQDEYFINQNETTETILFTYVTLANPINEITEEFFQQPILFNGKKRFTNDTDFSPFTLDMIWLTDGWYIVSDFNPLDGTYLDVIGRILINIDLPISSQWQTFGSTVTLIVPKKTVSNLSPQGFAFLATESKSIQIDIVNKRTGQVSKSNTIELTVN